MKFYKALLFFYFLSIVVACYQPKPPKFKRMEEIQLIGADFGKLKLKGKAVYQNQEKTSGELVGIHCDLYINNGFVTRIDQKINQFIKPFEEVVVPFEIDLDASQIMNGAGSFKNILQSLTEQSVNVKYDGHVTMRISGLDWDLPLTHTEQINLDFSF